MNWRTNPELVRALKTENMQQPIQLTEIPRDKWPTIHAMRNPPIAVWRNRRYLVQVFAERGGIKRITINRTSVAPNGMWEEHIPWDAIQDIKNAIGMGDMYAVEVYPRDCDKVDVANMRHIWVLPEPLHNVGWFKGEN